MRRWTQEAEDADPGAPCRRINTVYTMHAIFQEVAVKPDGYGALTELAMPQALRWAARRPHRDTQPQAGHLTLAPCCVAQVWKYRPEVQAQVGEVLARLELEEQPTFGFHVRGGDKLGEDKQGCARRRMGVRQSMRCPPLATSVPC